MVHVIDSSTPIGDPNTYNEGRVSKIAFFAGEVLLVTSTYYQRTQQLSVT